jgi:hypothetical protein
VKAHCTWVAASTPNYLPGRNILWKLSVVLVTSVAGGAMGYMKSGSQKSLAAGGISALILFFVHTQLPVRPIFASSIGLGTKKENFLSILVVVHLPFSSLLGEFHKLECFAFQAYRLHYCQWWDLASRSLGRYFQLVLCLLCPWSWSEATSMGSFAARMPDVISGCFPIVASLCYVHFGIPSVF